MSTLLSTPARRISGIALVPILFVLTLLASAAQAQIPPLEAVFNKEVEVPFVTTPQNVVDAMLALAQMRRGDTLIDLGSAVHSWCDFSLIIS